MQINPWTISDYWYWAWRGWTGRDKTDFSYFMRESFLTPIPGLEKNTYIKSVQQQKPITPPAPIPLHNKLFYWSGDNYLSHIIKHLEQIGGSNYRLPLGYPSSFIVLLLYITWWDLLCRAFPLHFSLALCYDTLTKGFGGQMRSFKVICHLFSVLMLSCTPLQTQIDQQWLAPPASIRHPRNIILI